MSAAVLCNKIFSSLSSLESTRKCTLLNEVQYKYGYADDQIYFLLYSVTRVRVCLISVNPDFHPVDYRLTTCNVEAQEPEVV